MDNDEMIKAITENSQRSKSNSHRIDELTESVEALNKMATALEVLATKQNVMAEVVKAAEAAGIREKVKIMVGGAPVNQDYCDSIGADCYTTDAASAADAAVALCKEILAQA